MFVGIFPTRGDYKGYYLKKLSEKNNDIFFIDDITSNDLNLDLIFNNINGSLTSLGEEYLYYLLHSIKFNDEEIRDFRTLQKRINSDENLRIKLMEGLSFLGKLNKVSAYGVVNSLFDSKPSKLLKDVILDIIFVLSFVLIFISPGLGVLTLLLVLIISISSYFKGRAKMDENLKAFCYLQRLIKCGLILREYLDEYNIDELSSLLKFSFLLPKKEGTSSDPISIILDYFRMIFHIDVILYNIRLNSIIDKKQIILNLYEEIAKLDAALSMASFCLYQPFICEPVFNQEGNSFEADKIYHPLVANPVFNDIKEKKGALITGSNASGKSTFLKMVGISILFSQSFGFAFAEKISLNHFKLYTSMALSDNILGKESYYIVESKSLKRICDESLVSSNIFCIVDEVLRGTNTSERIAASCQILKYLKKNGVLVFTATHDTELTELLKDDYNLYYFTEDIRDKDVIFTYKIQEGVVNKTNAIRLLDSLGYDKEIIQEANNLVEIHKQTGKWGR